MVRSVNNAMQALYSGKMQYSMGPLPPRGSYGYPWYRVKGAYRVENIHLQKLQYLPKGDEVSGRAGHRVYRDSDSRSASDNGGTQEDAGLSGR